MLLSFAISHAKELRPRLELVFLHVIEHNKAAARFYKNSGFTLYGKYKSYYTIGEKDYGALLFTKEIKKAEKAEKHWEFAKWDQDED
mmetsp:Transcript_24187/g.27897  ORF Transcript_24187/g.27897 Transcript_24187/m.27897 type:complete len:87 (-) Transcript_24187:19-279(-)